MSTYSSNLQLQLIATGDQAGTWGNTTNTNLGTLLEQAVSSYVTQAFSNANITLNVSQGADGGGNTTPGTIYTAGTTGSPVSYRNMFIECTGTSSGNNLIVPANPKLYIVYNNITSGGGSITVTTPSGTGVAVPVGAKAFLVCNGTNVVSAISYFSGISSNNYTVTGSTIPANGIYLPSANTIGIATNTTQCITVNATGNTVLNAPTSGIGLVVNGFSGTHSTKIADSANTPYNAGFLEVPINAQTVSYPTVLSDSGKTIYYNGATPGSVAYSIPPNSGTGSVTYPIGTVLTFINNGSAAGTISIICADTMYLAGAGTTGTRLLARYGIATAVKVESTVWYVSGTNLT
jgi:hypothetical protein